MHNIRHVCLYQEILIEGILEEEFEQSDFDAALSVLREFGINATNPQNVADILKSHSSLFIALDRNEEAAITFLNDNSSKVCDNYVCNQSTVSYIKVHQYRLHLCCIYVHRYCCLFLMICSLILDITNGMIYNRFIY